MADRVRIFLAAPFVQFLVGDRVTDQWRHRLTALRERLLAGGAAVFNAHHNEGWGEFGLPPEQCVPSDFRGVVACDAVCAYAGDPVSAGVAVELGWASMLRKPIVLAADARTRLTPMIEGLGAVTRVETMRLADGLDDGAIEEMATTALRLAAEARTWAPPLWPGARLDAPLGYAALENDASELLFGEIPA
ncbi:TIR domain-containing protein [Streptoalloteichus hindustanus]|uniref:Nucleoside 2-deoxyribosyltransferase n=1 Tax=Streptoalloteichus hindustanus TaxID=2017 RepID=A0A1M5FB07_STRHI|nr:hypothetical protein [Streptoalloteichus hindustanus]SHF88251.1 hypothetical protein SAMN05444320_105335 [Streptoalloteichus hindustanus]